MSSVVQQAVCFFFLDNSQGKCVYTHNSYHGRDQPVPASKIVVMDKSL